MRALTNPEVDADVIETTGDVHASSVRVGLLVSSQALVVPVNSPLTGLHGATGITQFDFTGESVECISAPLATMSTLTINSLFSVDTFTGTTCYTNNVQSMGASAQSMYAGTAKCDSLLATQAFVDSATSPVVTAETIRGNTLQSSGSITTDCLAADTLVANELYLTSNAEYLFGFSKSVVALYDFLDPADICRDISGRDLHAINVGVVPGSPEQATDASGKVMTGTACFRQPGRLLERTTRPQDSVYMDVSGLVPALHACSVPGMACWFQVDGRYVSEGKACILYLEGSQYSMSLVWSRVDGYKWMQLEFRRNRALVWVQRYDSTPVYTDKWVHVILSLGETGPQLFLNGTLQTATTIGGAAFTWAGFGSLGVKAAFVGRQVGAEDVRDLEFSGFSGSISRLFFFDSTPSAAFVDLIYAADCYGYDFYPLMGQSNMVGTNTKNPPGNVLIEPGVDDDASLLQGRAFQLGIGDIVKPVTFPLDWTIIQAQAGASLWKTFAETILPYTHPFKRLLFAPFAVGGSALNNHNGSDHDWNIGEYLFETRKASAVAAFATTPLIQMAAVLWHQGEGDSTNFFYGTQFHRSFENIFQSLGIDRSTTPFVVGEVNVSNGQTNVFFTASTAADPRAWFGFVPLKDLASTDPASQYYQQDGVHFNRVALRIFGTRYAQKLIDMVSQRRQYSAARAYSLADRNARRRAGGAYLLEGRVRSDYSYDYDTASALDVRNCLSWVHPLVSSEARTLAALGGDRTGTVKTVYNTGGNTGTLSVSLTLVHADGSSASVVVIPPRSKYTAIWVGRRWA